METQQAPQPDKEDPEFKESAETADKKEITDMKEEVIYSLITLSAWNNVLGELKNSDELRQQFHHDITGYSDLSEIINWVKQEAPELLENLIEELKEKYPVSIEKYLPETE